MKITIEELQEALVMEMITLPQFVEVIIDNYGIDKATEILASNLRLAMDNDYKD